MFCEHCKKDITEDKNRYDDIDITDDIFGEYIYDVCMYDEYFGKNKRYFDLCNDCFDKLKVKLFKVASEFLVGGDKDDNN